MKTKNRLLTAEVKSAALLSMVWALGLTALPGGWRTRKHSGTTSKTSKSPSSGMVSETPMELSQWADSGVNTTPPKDNPVDVSARAMDRSAPGNHWVISVVATTNEIPAFPTPKRENKPYTCQTCVAHPTRPSAVPAKSAPAIMIVRTLKRASSAAT